MNKLLFYLIILLFAYQTTYSHIRLIYPVGGESLNTGKQFNIQWDPYIDHGPATYTLEYSTDGGNNWITIQTEISKNERSYYWTVPNVQTNIAKIKVIQVNQEYDHITFISGEIIFTSVTSIDYESLNLKSFKLNNAYPNPFNNSTIISYQLPESNFTQMIIYDLRGREIKKIVNQIKFAGKHEVSWNAVGLSSGTYFAVLKAGNNVATEKLLLIK